MKAKILRLASAWFDFDAAESIAKTVISQYGQHDSSENVLGLHRDPIFSSLQMSCVVSYARPFTENHGMGTLSGKQSSYQRQDWQQLHEDMLSLRHKLFAHSDIDFRSILVTPSRNSIGGIQADRFGLSATSILLSWPQFLSIQDMCANRKAILWPEIQYLLGQLYPGVGEPYMPVILNKTP